MVMPREPKLRSFLMLEKISAKEFEVFLAPLPNVVNELSFADLHKKQPQKCLFGASNEY